MLSGLKAGAAGPTSNLYGCWNHGFSDTECYPALRPELLALHQASMHVGTTASVTQNAIRPTSNIYGYWNHGFSDTECYPALRPELLALHQTSNHGCRVLECLGRVREDHGCWNHGCSCLLYTSPSPRDRQKSRMPSSA